VSGLVILVAAATLGLAACGGGPASPRVASLGPTTTLGNVNANGGGGGTTTTVATGNNPTQLLNEWATCMRSNGDPNQVDPTVDAYGVININIGSGASATLSGQVHAGGGPCSSYLAAAQSALRAADPVAPPPDQTQQVKYVNCMRANGVPNYPYPNGNTSNFDELGIDPNSPVVENANKVCGRQIGAPAWWIAGTGPPGDVVVTSCVGPASLCNGPPSSGGNRPAPGAVRPGGSGASSVPVTNG
jgi:hypothetical protein